MSEGCRGPFSEELLMPVVTDIHKYENGCGAEGGLAWAYFHTNPLEYYQREYVQITGQSIQ